VRRAALALALLSLAACGRSCRCGAPALVDGGDDDDPAEAGAKLGDGELAAERCKLEGAPLVIAPGPIEIGRAEARATGEVSFGVATAGAAEVVTVAAASGAPLRVVDRVALGRLAGDAPPPRVVAGASTTWAVFYPTPGDAGTKRALRIAVLEGSPRSARVVGDGPPESLDESLAYDAAALADGTLLLAWDDDDGDRGVIRTALVRDGKLSEPRTISQSKGDASAPRVVARADGFVVAWKARRDETQSDGGAKLPQDNELEGPGELRGFDWVEAVRLGTDGAPIGPPTKLFPDNGHVAGFDLGPNAAGAVDVYARDAAQRGKLLHLTWRPGEASAPATVLDVPPAAGVPQLVVPWLVWDDGTSRTLAAPLDPGTGAPLGKASAESVFGLGNVLANIAPGAASDAGGDARLLVVEPAPIDRREGAAGTTLRTAICAH
jgi:hypothetical protein